MIFAVSYISEPLKSVLVSVFFSIFISLLFLYLYLPPQFLSFVHIYWVPYVVLCYRKMVPSNTTLQQMPFLFSCTYYT